MKSVGTRGFTIVELLIVVVVIAILAAITIVSYRGITNQAHDTAVKANLRTIQEKIGVYYALNGAYPNSSTLPGAVAPFVASKGSYATTGVTDHNLIYCMTSGATEYAIVAYSKSGKKFTISSTAGLTEYTNAWTDQTVACQGALTNYSSNYRGYAGEDTVTGPWRPWANGGS